MSVEAEKNGQASGYNFAADIFNAITNIAPGGEKDTLSTITGNVIISPLLLEAALVLLYLGSDGVTAEELGQKLQLKRFANNAKMANYFAALLEAATQDPDTKIQSKSEIWLQDQLQIADEFQKIAEKYFHLTAQRRSAAETQAAVELAAHEAGNAILFSVAELQFKWFLPFSAYRSGMYDFHPAARADAVPAATAPVAMLFDDDMFVKFGEFRELDARAIELPLEHEQELAMLLLLPNKRDGLAALEQQLRQLNLAELTEQRMQMESVQVLLPKFRIDFECDVRPALEQLGITSIFNKDANFKNLQQQPTSHVENENVQFSKILHKIHIEVNESGSQCSDVVANKPIVISNSINARQKFFRADHPFYFAIRNGDVTYFVGHVTTP